MKASLILKNEENGEFVKANIDDFNKLDGTSLFLLWEGVIKEFESTNKNNDSNN